MGYVIKKLGPGDEQLVIGAPYLFDDPPIPEFTREFLADDRHHIFMALDDETGRALGFITGVETTHPDKGREMFLYELSVDDDARRQGIGTALTEALRDLSQSKNHYGMWVGTETDNDAAIGTYAKAGGAVTPAQLIIEWSFPQAT